MSRNHEQPFLLRAGTFRPSEFCPDCDERWHWKEEVGREGRMTIHIFCPSCGSVPINQAADELLATQLAGAASPLLTLSELARGLKVSEGTIQHYLKTGKLTGYRMFSGRYILPHDSLARVVSPATLLLATHKRLERLSTESGLVGAQ